MSINIDLTKIVTSEQKQVKRQEDMQASVAAAVQSHIDYVVKSWGYNNAETLVGYKSSGIEQWHKEAVAFIEWRDAVWITVFGHKENPETAPETIADLIESLPIVNRPE